MTARTGRLLSLLSLLWLGLQPAAGQLFGVRTDYPSVAFLNDVAVGDLNADNRPDMVTASNNSGQGNVLVYYNQGSGTFAPPVTYTVTDEANSVAIGDVNNDGRPDIVTLGSALQVLLGRAAAGYGTPVRSNSNLGIYTTGRMLLRDVNADGFLDVVYGRLTISGAWVALGTGTGTFGTPTAYSSAGESRAFDLADITGDGRPDLVVATAKSFYTSLQAKLSVLPGLSSGGFGNFNQRIDYDLPAINADASAVVVADFNGDGRPDVVTANELTDNLSVWLGLAGGGLGTRTDLPLSGGSAPRDVVVGDVNGDGHLDLVAANSGDWALFVLLGTGTGTFGPPTQYLSGRFPQNLALADLNGDGRLDAIAQNYTLIDVSVLLNIGGATGAPPAISSFTPGSGAAGTTVTVTGTYFTGASSLTVGGVAVSGFTVVSPTQISFTVPAGAVGGPISVVTPNGTATSSTAFTVPGGLPGYVLSGAPLTTCAGLLYDSGGASGDYANGENTTTVLTPATTGARVQLSFSAFNLEDGRDFLRIYDGATASAATLIGTYTGTTSPGTITAANGTGKLTLVFTSDAATTAPGFAASLNCVPGPASTFTLLTRTPASNSTTAAATTTITGFFSAQPALASINNYKVFSSQVGGQRALRGATLSGFTVTLRTSQPYLKAGETVQVTVPATVTSTTGVAAAPYVYQFTTATQLGSGIFGFKNEHAATTPADVALGDITGDGVLDIVTANQSGSGISVRPGSATGGFGFRADYPAAGTCSSLVLGDVNNDGRLDVVATNRTTSTVAVLLTTDAGTLAAPVTYSAGALALGLALGDVNGDGRLDLVVSNSGSAGSPGNMVAVYLNAGQGRFGLPAEYAAGSRPHGVALGDVNNDGRLDLVATNEGSNTVSVLLGTGTGSFLAPTSYAVGTAPTRTAVADVNGDAYLDLVTSNPGSNTVSVLLNTRIGSFAAKVDYPAGTDPRDVAIGDVNGDGRLDLVTANAATNSASVLFNTGPTGFAAPVGYGTNTGAAAVALADVDDDKRLDLATANPAAGTVSVLLGLPAAVISSFSPVRGPVGTTVTIYGENLTGATSLTLNGVAVSGFVVNAGGTGITFVVPAGAQSGPIVVTTPLGTVSSAGGFCVQYTPTVTAANRCGAGALTLTAAGVPTGGSYAWYASSSSNTVLSTSPSFTTPSLTTTTTYYVAISTGQGNTVCDGPRTAVVATINAIPATPTITQPTPGTLRSSATTGNQWYLGGALIPGATAQTYTVPAGQTGPFTVVVTSAAGCVSQPSAPASVVLATRGAQAAGLRLYPNPAHGTLYLERDQATTAATVQVLDAVGKCQWQGPWRGEQLRIPLGQLPAGVYTVRVQLPDQATVFERVIID